MHELGRISMSFKETVGTPSTARLGWVAGAVKLGKWHSSRQTGLVTLTHCFLNPAAAAQRLGRVELFRKVERFGSFLYTVTIKCIQ